MKSILKKLISSLLLIVLVTGVSAQRKEEKKAKRQKAYQECVELMKNGAFKFEAERAYPQGGGSIDLTTNYGFLKISENKSECDLPFFGRAYRMEYGGDGGMNFEGEIFNEKWTLNDKKMKVTYTFDVKDKETFTVIMEVFSKESASTIIRCDTKAHISYSGQIAELKKEDLDEE
ncbi:DUF4251 domain-containing protein [Ancylomarina sp. DW003]|nr:DUF4251 domain-containing protein [Ancylomarina sp. DW003]MDE5421553.1 DUF4251 domain-containing protein [Ancylomarina sp. DW003]